MEQQTKNHNYMARLTPLPEELKYLQPFRKKFASRPSEELDETAFASLLQILEKRIAGLSDEAAEKLLDQDSVALSNWLSAPEQSTDCLHFAKAAFYIASPSEMLRMIREQSEKQKQLLPCVEMDLWPDVKPRRFEEDGDGGMFVKRKGLLFAIGVVSEETAAKGQRPASLHVGYKQVTSSPVRFGGVTGTKYVGIIDDVTGVAAKSIIYVLAVPGGHVEVSVVFIGKRPKAKCNKAKTEEDTRIDLTKWDETPVESFFHTLRVVMKQP